MATTKIRSSSIEDGQVANVDLSATIGVTGGQIADNAVTLAKMAGLVRGKIIVGDASGDPSALTVGASTQVLTSDGTDAAWAAAGVNTPTWWVGMSSATQGLSDMVKTIIELDDVEFNVGFTWDTVNFKGTPGTAGKYLINCYAHMGDLAAGNNAGLCEVSLFVDTTEVAVWGIDVANTTANTMKVGGSTILDLSAANYLQMKCTIDSATATVKQVNATKRSTYLCGMKLIEA
jgi:hypothetical protein